MADEVLDTLKIKVSAETDEAEKKITALAEAIQTAFNGRGSTKTGEKLKSISEAANGINASASGNVASLAEALGKLGNIKISATIANQLTKIGAALKSIDSGDIAKLKDLTDSIGAINASGGVGNIKVQVPKAEKRTEPQMPDLSKSISDIDKPIVLNVDTTQVEHATELVNYLSDVIAQISGRQLMPPQSDTSGFENIRNAIEGSVESMGVFQTTGRIVDVEIQDIGNSARSASHGFSNIGESLRGIGGAARTAFSFMANGMSAALPYAKKLASALAKIGLAMGKATGKFLSAPFVSLGKAISNTTTRLKGFLTRIGRIALYRAIRSAIKEITQGFKEGIDNAYEWSKINGGQLAKSMNSLATSAQYVKNSLGAMAAPLLNALAPAIDFVADKLVALINLFNQVFAKFTGASTWMRAKKQAVEYQGAADGATAATKRFKATILGIDEINPLQDNSDNGGGGGGGGADYGSMFEEVPVDSSIADFVQDIKDRINEGDWEGVGSLISDKLVAAMDQIDWNAVYAKADKFGVNFASFLNGLFETKVDPKTGIEKNVFTAVGETAAGALNTALHFIDKVGETFNFKEFGEGLALGVTTFLNKFDWKTALSAAENWGSGIATALNGFIKKQDKNGKTVFSSIGETVASAINTALKYLESFVPTFDANALGSGIATAIVTAIQGINWKSAIKTAGDIGEKIAETLNGFLTTKDKNGNTAFSSLGQTVANLLVAGVNAWSKFTTTFKFDELGNQIASAINSFFRTMNENNGWSKLITVSADTLKGIVTVVTNAIKGLNKEEISQSFSSVVGTALGEGLKLISFTAETISSLVTSLGELFGKVLDKEWAKTNILDPMLKGFASAFNVDISATDVGTALTKAIYNMMAKTWNAGIDMLAAATPLPKKFWELFKMQLMEDSATSENVGNELAKSIQESIQSEGSVNKLVKTGKIVGNKITVGAKEYDYGGVLNVINEDVAGGDKAVSVLNKIGKKAGKQIAVGLKSKDYSNVMKAIGGQLSTEEALAAFKKAGLKAGEQFKVGFKTYKLNIDGTVVVSKVQLTKEAAQTLGNNAHFTNGGNVQVVVGHAKGAYDIPNGEFFVAREKGPEMVGTIGGHTSVANNDQIVEGISSGVYAANQEQNALLRQQNALLAQLLEKDSGGGGGQVTVSSIVTGVDRYNRRAGKTVMATA